MRADSRRYPPIIPANGLKIVGLPPLRGAMTTIQYCVATEEIMACDRFALSNSGSPASRRNLRRDPLAASMVVRPAVTPVVRQRNRFDRFESALHYDVTAELATATARIAELEAALREARDVASHDPLTGAFNRRGMTEAFAREAARAQRSGQPLAVALIDLDDFKRVNDQHGHAVGDAALVHLTRVIGETLRPTDLCGRLGGEEFVLVMPGSDHAAAKRALARLQVAIAAQPVAHTQVTLAFSAGLVLGQHSESLEQMLVRADDAVYRAKAAGKRCVVCA
jgi:diguanylate cyclase (GGDEF)-like protein